jgi:hypothetical protein
MIIQKTIRKAIIYAFLCIYSFAVIKPVLPIANDIIAHTFYKMQHMATVHFENGKYHIHAELARESDQQKDSKGNIPASAYETVTHHISSDKTEFIKYASSPEAVIFPSDEHPHDAFIRLTNPPPEDLSFSFFKRKV